ncbi:unnamed protein product [Urochloa decumbens]|uniref:Uncharacterized protein n=1 Tax=Urochloa decumbens TaxID=240449 RepID=A0ABC9FBC2_9POAL
MPPPQQPPHLRFRRRPPPHHQPPPPSRRRRRPPPLHQPPPPSRCRRRRRQKEKMAHKVIHSHADLEDLQGICSPRAQQGIRSDERVYVRVVSLESVRIAHESYALLRQLVDLKSCLTPHLDLLSLVACLSLELHKVEHDLLPPLQDQEARLEGRVVQVLLSMRNSATTLLRLAESVQGIEELCGLFEEELDDGAVSGRVKEVGIVLMDTADLVLKGTYNLVLLKERVPHLVKLISDLMATPVRIS